MNLTDFKRKKLRRRRDGRAKPNKTVRRRFGANLTAYRGILEIKIVHEIDSSEVLSI